MRDHSQHPSTMDFEYFLSPKAPDLTSRSDRASRNAWVVRHLLADCPRCRQLLVDMRNWREPVASWDYSRAFAGAERALYAFFAKGKTANSTPDKLWAELSSLPQEQQELWVVTYRRFANPPLIHKLIEMSNAERHKDPRRMLHLANLARLAAVVCAVEAADSSLSRPDTKPQ